MSGRAAPGGRCCHDVGSNSSSKVAAQPSHLRFQFPFRCSMIPAKHSLAHSRITVLHFPVPEFGPAFRACGTCHEVVVKQK